MLCTLRTLRTLYDVLYTVRCTLYCKLHFTMYVTLLHCIGPGGRYEVDGISSCPGLVAPSLTAPPRKVPKRVQV